MYLGLLAEGVYLPQDYWLRPDRGIVRVEMEIGSGSGGFILEAARARHDTMYVGLEIRESLVRQLAEREDLPPNLDMIHGDGRWIVEHLIADESVDAFHVYFPDPWWKKRHQKRRLFTPELCAALWRCLKPEGVMHLATDVAVRFEEIRVSLAAAGFVERSPTGSPENPGQSSYERKYRRQGRRIYQSLFTKSAVR